MRKAALLLVPLFLFACDREPVAPEISPTFDAHAPPAESGIVTRVADGINAGWYALDTHTGLWILVGVPAADFCDGPPYAFDRVDIQYATLPNDGRFVLRGSAEVLVTIWEIGAQCVADPIASGYVSYRETDNDFAGVGTHNANAYGWMANGRVDLTAGGTALLNAHDRFIWGVGTVSQKVVLK